MSVTVPPTGQCYRLAARIIDKLSRLSGGGCFPPHLTLQAVFNEALEPSVAAAVKKTAEQTPPFQAQIDGLGILPAAYDPEVKFVYLRVAKSDHLIALYLLVKTQLENAGAETYPYRPDEWIPHITVASGRWSWRQAEELIAELSHTDLDCRFPVRTLRLNRAEPDGRWTTVMEVPLKPSKSDPQSSSDQAAAI